jgi:hypothetical protein
LYLAQYGDQMATFAAAIWGNVVHRETTSACLSLVTCAALALGERVATAHHSFAAFDRERNVILSGTVKEFQWTNPHAWIQLLVPEGNEQREWSIEAGSPNMMARQGWKSRTLKPGDKISLVMHPIHSGAAIGSLVSVTLADGTVLGPGGAPAPSTGNAPPP